jgi:hypothetical protein
MTGSARHATPSGVAIPPALDALILERARRRVHGEIDEEQARAAILGWLVFEDAAQLAQRDVGAARQPGDADQQRQSQLRDAWPGAQIFTREPAKVMSPVLNGWHSAFGSGILGSVESTGGGAMLPAGAGPNMRSRAMCLLGFHDGSPHRERGGRSVRSHRGHAGVTSPNLCAYEEEAPAIASRPSACAQSSSCAAASPMA